MHLINQVAFETPYGLRSIELFDGDLTAIAFKADLLVISAFHSGYAPVEGTVIAALQNRLNINVRDLRQHQTLDMCSSLGIWISRELPDGPFRRILGVELVGHELTVGELLQNVFVGLAILEAKGMPVASIVLPVLGAGSQGISPTEVLTALLPAAQNALQRSPTLERISFVEINPERAAELDKAMNLVLSRSNVLLPKKPLLQNLRADILAAVSKNQSLVPVGHRNLIEELRHVLNLEAARSFEIGILGRRLAEFVVDDLLNKKKSSPNLDEKIDQLANFGIAGWIRSYLHVLRILGNETAHEKDNTGKRPSYASEEDLVIALFCLLRVWNFWITWKIGEK